MGITKLITYTFINHYVFLSKPVHKINMHGRVAKLIL